MNTNLRTGVILERGKQWDWASICISNREKWVSKKEASRVLCRHPVNQERGAWSEAVNRKESESISEVHQRRSSDDSQTKTSSIKAGGCATPLPLHSRSTLPFLLDQADTTCRRIQTHFLYASQEVRQYFWLDLWPQLQRLISAFIKLKHPSTIWTWMSIDVFQ